jgi:recombination protein RecA
MAAVQRLIAAIQRRWGERALRSAGTPPATPLAALPTGFATLDAALRSGGLPRGRITELLGLPTSGATTIALRTLATAQAGGERAGYVDPHATFDAEYAAWCGVDLSTLLLIRPHTLAEMPDLLVALAGSGGLGALLVDDLVALQGTPGGAVLLRRMLRTLPAALARSSCTLLLLTRLPYAPAVIGDIGFHGSAPGEAATLRLHVARAAWLAESPAAPGCRVRVTVLKQPQAPPGATADLTLHFTDDWSIQ